MDRNDYYGGDSTSLNLNQVSNSYNFCLSTECFRFVHRFLVITKLLIDFAGTSKLTCFPLPFGTALEEV
jgi:RAB protein geranylgeranyltransferase component A